MQAAQRTDIHVGLADRVRRCEFEVREEYEDKHLDLDDRELEAYARLYRPISIWPYKIPSRDVPGGLRRRSGYCCTARAVT